VWIASPDWYRPDVTHTHGHRNRYGTNGENKLPDEAKAERREVIEHNKAWRAAEPVRRDYIRALLARTKVPKGPALRGHRDHGQPLRTRAPRRV
jgi:ParB family chromosome partitioning protein